MDRLFPTRKPDLLMVNRKKRIVQADKKLNIKENEKTDLVVF